jgi:hypothetical protein
MVKIPKEYTHRVKWTSIYSQKPQEQWFSNGTDAKFFAKLLDDRGRPDLKLLKRKK